MSTAPETQKRKPVALWWFAAALMALALGGAGIVVWRTWTPEDPEVAAEREAEAKQKQEEAEKKKLEDFEIASPAVQPSEPKADHQFVKPGHWTSATERMTANFADFVGQSNVTIVKGQNDVYPVDHTQFQLRSTRPVTLSKGRPKEIDSTFLAPLAKDEMQLATELTERGFGATARPSPAPLTRMPSYQYHFVILAKEPNRYAFIKSLDSVKVPFNGVSDADDTEATYHYLPELLKIDRTVPLAENALAWTSIAYVLWDNADPQSFTPDQQQALVDWLHWGGQLIVSGPDSLDGLKGSFLEPYLPATSGGSRAIAAADLADLNRGWTIAARRGKHEPLRLPKPWSGVKLDLQPGGHELDSTGGLFAERSVGRGRIVVSAMQLAERELVNWKGGYESLFNACLLRRPPREYQPGHFGDVTLLWADKDLKDHRLDARLTTSVRYLARDLGVDANYRYENVDNVNKAYYPNQPVPRQLRPPEHFGGIGAWNDFSDTANTARETLLDGAGVDVPGPSFIVICLAVYLVALVPLNWLVFHALGRIELAWIAAPLIAVAATYVVIRQAQLDIGFVRAQTEIGLLELQPEYPRGHLARYTALYTSLSTTYDFNFDDLTTVAAPFPLGADLSKLKTLTRATVDYERYDKVRLAGLFISSNTTNMVHSEQMLPLAGMIRLGKSKVQNNTQIENRSQFPLRSVAIVRRPNLDEQKRGRAVLEGVWIGELRPDESALVAFAPLSLSKDQVAFADERTAEDRLQHATRLDLERMFRLALDPENLEPGEKRLVARVDDLLPGETVSPAASQIRGATLVVAHLEYAPLPKPRPDLNIRQDIAAEKPKDDEP
ncbi:MAG TPA: hypothetical protein VGM76_03520 [Lacipirellulaceae bacterium]|jgi:hypothetical protein